MAHHSNKSDKSDRSIDEEPGALEAAQAAAAAGSSDTPPEFDPRLGLDRRNPLRAVAPHTGLERRRGAGIRREDDRRSAEEGEMTVEQFEFIMAIETYKKANKRMYPTLTEVLEVFNQLGYRKVQAREIKLTNVPEPQLFGSAPAVTETVEVIVKPTNSRKAA